MENYIWLLIVLPMIWYAVLVSYQLINLFYLWIKYKFENIKIKEYQLWD